MRITSKGQVTIPQEIREAAGFMPNTEVEFVLDGDLVFLVKRGDPRKPTRGTRAIELLRDTRADFKGATTDQIMAHLRGWE